MSVEVIEQLFNDRHSCRAFSDERVAPETIRRLVDLARRSPSWCNTQPWEVLITEPAATERLRGKLVDFAQTHDPEPDVPFPASYPGEYGDRRRTCGWQLYESVGIARGDRTGSAAQALRNFALFDAPHVAIVTGAKDLGTYGALDCGVFLGHFLIAAQSLGLATIAQAALASVAPALRAELAIPDDRQVLFGVSFGYAKPEDPANGFRTERAGVDEVLTMIS